MTTPRVAHCLKTGVATVAILAQLAACGLHPDEEPVWQSTRDAAYGQAFADGFAPQLHLHARRLSIPHPDGGFLSVEAPLPKHMRDSFLHLGFTIPETAKPKRVL